MKKYSSPKIDVIDIEDVIMASGGIKLGTISDYANAMTADWDTPDYIPQ